MIGLMTLITFYNRYALLSPNVKITIGPKLQSFLKYTAPAVLTSLWVPIVFVKEQQINLDLSDPYLSAGLITVIVSLFIRKPLIIVITGLIIFTVLTHGG